MSASTTAASEKPLENAAELLASGSPPSRTAALELLHKRIAERGDLPIVRQNSVRILTASENTKSGAADVARLVLRDMGFAAKVLKLANSAYFNRGRGQVNTVSKAVVLLGLETIRQISLGLAFVELFQEQHPQIDIKRLIASSFASAVLGEDLARRVGHPRPEEVFVAALLNKLGTISLAYYLPEVYMAVRQRQSADPNEPTEDVERNVFGVSGDEIGAHLSNAWQLPDLVTEGISAARESLSSPPKSNEDQIACMASLANHITNNLYSETGSSNDLDFWVTRLQLALNIKPAEAVRIVETSYGKVKQMADSFGIGAAPFLPVAAGPQNEDNGTRKRLVRRVVDRLTRTEPKEQAKAAEPPPEASPNQEPQDRSSLQLKFLREITWHLLTNQDVQTLFNIILEGMHRGIGLQRVILALCNPERTRVRGRCSVGQGAEEVADQIDLPLDASNIFGKVYLSRKPYFVESVERLGVRNLIPDFLKCDAKSLVLAPIQASDKVIGFFYADRIEEAISQDEYEAFMHFAFQSNLGLERINS